MKKFDVMVQVEVQDNDADLITNKTFDQSIRQRFDGTAIKVTDVFLVKENTQS